jgi:hypothetical protein
VYSHWIAGAQTTALGDIATALDDAPAGAADGAREVS